MKKGWIILFLAGASIVAGLALNSTREKALPLAYKNKETRIQDSVEKLGADEPAEVNIREIEQDEFLILMEKKPVLLDARPEVFHRLGHIPGAQSLPREEFEEAYSRLRGELERRMGEAVLIYCSREDCEDSHLVAKGLAKLGFREIAILRGGWSEWQRNGQAVEKAP